jgi:hypothetical protein
MAEIDRKSRDSQSREKTERRNDWKPPSALDAPEAPIGYKHRWIRESVMEYDDKNNIHKRRREGYELVKAEDYPEFDAPVIDEGKNAGVIGTGGLLLARIPEEIVEQRENYFKNKTQTQMDAVDRDWMRENNPVMPKLKPQRNSNVSFGNNPIVGVFNGVQYTDPTTKEQKFSNFYPASTNASDIIAFVIDDPNVIYEIQCNAAFPIADLFGNFDIAYTSSGSTTTGISGAELDVATGATTAGLPLKCIDISQDPENSDVASDATNVHVVIQNSIFGQKGAGLA